MTFYAHTRENRPKSEWEPLARHLAEVAHGAGGPGERCHAGALAELAGRVHDLGKHGPDFQARLRDPAVRADHSTAGAVWAIEHLGPKWGPLLAHVVAGHHAGLQDDLLGAGDRIAAKRGTLAAVERAALADGLRLPPGVAGPVGQAL